MTKVAAALAISVSIFASISSATATYAAGASDVAPGKNKEALILRYTTIEQTGSPTPGGVVQNLGGAISGGFYGNTSNAGIDPDKPANGHGVTPSSSPGPQVIADPQPGTGTSIGDAIQALR